MLVVTDSASTELQKVLAAPEHSGKHLILYFQGVGWSGPAMGMALDESTDKLDKIESNGVTAYIDPKVAEYLKPYGSINIDYVTRADAQGYVIKVGNADCATGGCKGCG